MGKTQQIIHEKQAIFYMDFSNLTKLNEINEVVDESIRHIRSQPKGSVLTLTNIKGMHFSKEVKEIFNEFIKGNKPYVKAGAVIGVSGLQQILYNSLMKLTGRDIKSFDSFDQAKEWLTGRNQ